MALTDPEFVKTVVETTERVALSDAAAKRIARTLKGTRGVLDAVAAQSMFDTEPAQFVRTLEALAAAEDRNG